MIIRYTSYVTFIQPFASWLLTAFLIYSSLPYLYYAGSQIIADRKKEFAGQVRNALIDDQTLSNENKTIRSGVKVNADAISDVDSERRNSFDTNSTDIDIDDKVEGSEVFEDFGKKPRWHPPWQLKQVDT